MPDYNLGRARGHVEITGDSSGARREINEYRDSLRAAGQSTEQLDRVEQERNRRAAAAQDASRRRRIAEDEYRRVLNDTTASTEDVVRAEAERNSARGAHLQASRRAAEAERALNAALRGNSEELDRFTRRMDGASESMDRASRRTRDFRDQINDTDRTVRTLANSITSILMPAMRSMMMLGAIGVGGGLLGLLGAGGAQGAIAVIGALASVITQLSGAVALLPAAFGGAVAVMGVFTVAMRGVGDALGAAMANDPKKFAEAIKEMGPATQSVVRGLASFTDAFKGAMRAVQDSFFQPLVGVIEPLIRTWLPMLMQAGQQIANVLGRAGAEIAGWLQQANTIEGFQEFIRNLVSAMERLLPAIQPVADAFLTLTRVGSQFFPQIADSLVRMANSFNNMVQGAAADGSLQRWIQGALDGFADVWEIIKNVGVALGNIGSLSGQQGGFLQWLVDVTAQFRAWTESAEGTQTITTFFESVSNAAGVLGPILQIIGGALVTLFSDMTTLGVNIGPGLNTFFQGLADALGILGQALIASGPAFNTILSTLGTVLVQIMQEIGPELPGLFQSLADVVVDLAPALVSLAGALADVLGSLTPGQIEIILGVVVAFQALATVGPIVIGAITGIAGVAAALGVSFGVAIGVIGAVVVAVGLLVAAIVYCVTHWDQVKAVAQAVWIMLQQFGSWLATQFTESLKSIGNAFVEAWNTVRDTVTGWFSEAYNWGRNVVSRFIDGLRDMFQPLSDAWNWLVGEGIDEKNPHSPPRKGPLSGSGDPLAAGQRVSERFATGIQQGAGSVSSAYDSTIGTGAFASRGGAGATTQVNPNFGGGSNGMNAFVESITRDMQAFLGMMRSGFGVFEKLTDLFVRTTTVVASLWNNGDNPMTRRGGIFSEDPGLTPQQQRIPGVENYEEPGTAPMPELTPQGNQQPGSTPVVPQVTVPGVPSTPRPGAPAAPPPPPPATPPRPAPGPGTPRANAPIPAVANLPQTGSLGDQEYGRPDVGERTEAGFDQWVYDVAAAFGIGASTYEGHQTGAAANQGHAPNPEGENRGIDWWPVRNGQQYTDMSGQSYTPEEVARLQAFAEWLDRNGLAEQVIWRNPQTGQEVGFPHHADFSENYAGHEGHVHSRHSRNIVLPAPAAPGGQTEGDRQRERRGTTTPPSTQPLPPGQDPLTEAGLYPPITPPRDLGNGGQDTNTYRDTDFGGIDSGPVSRPMQPGDPGYRPPQTEGDRQRERRGLPPRAGTPSATLGPNPSKQEIVNYIVGKALGAGYSRQQADWFAIQAAGESGYNPLANGGNQDGTGDVGGIFQFTPGTWGDRPGSMWNAKDNIDQYFALAEERGLTPGSFTEGRQLGTQVSIGGPWHPQNERKGHLTNAREVAAPYLANVNGAPIPPNAPPPPPPAPNQGPVGTPQPPTGPSAIPSNSTNDDWMNVPNGWDINQPIPPEVIAENLGIPVDQARALPPMFYAAQPGTVTNVYAPDDPAANNRGVVSTPLPTPGGTPGFTETQQNLPFGASTPMQAFQSTMASVGSIAADAFAVFDNVIKSIGATANLMDMLVRGPSSTEDIMSMIDNVQQYITTAASVAKLVGSIGGMVGGAGSGDPTGMTGAVGGGIQAIAGIVQSALEATNMAIDFGQEVWHQVSKYGALFAGSILGGENGFLGGNVRMLLNTATGEIQAYSEDNPMQKTIHNMPDWMSRAYGGTRPETQPPRLAQVNIFAGPGQTPRDMMNESMWLVNNDGAAASIAGAE